MPTRPRRSEPPARAPHPAPPALLPPLAVLLLLLPLGLVGPAAAERREAPGPEPLGPATSADAAETGTLLLRRGDTLHAAPTVDTVVEIEVSGMIARTTVRQRFTNPSEEWVEGVYVFPLPERSAVDRLEMRVGERLIRGRVEERARARARYRQAKQSGRKASLVEQERPNVFTASVANLGPGETVEVRLGYQEDVRYDAGVFSLRFPMVVAPRYVPGTRRVAGFSGTGWADATDSVPDAPRITPPVLDPATVPDPARRAPVAIRVEIDAGFPLTDVRSASHAVTVRALGGGRHAVTLDERTVPANADFRLAWRAEVGRAPGAALFRERWAGEDYVLLMVLPPSEVDPATHRPSRELIVVIDTSGSMAGASIEQARRAVAHALGRLRPEDSFNVIRFDSGFTSLHPDSVPATTSEVAAAQRWVAGLEANGGTEMLPALRAALRTGRAERAVRQVIFVTDGAVGNEAALFEAIERDLGRSRLHPVGIGSAPNAHFMSRAARFGRGSFTAIGSPEEVEERMRGLFKKLDHPVLHDLSIDWGEGPVESWPARLPDVHLGEPVVVAARLAPDSERLVLRGRRAGETVRIELPIGGGADHAGVARLWARRKVAGLMDSLRRGADERRVSTEVAGIGVRHQLVTRWSSLVAVDVTPTAPVDAELRTRAIPTLLPKGWDFRKLSGPVPAVPIQQPRTQVMIGSLPQGGTASALLLRLGALLLAAAGLLLGLVRRTRVVG